MAKQLINIGSLPNDGTGDTLRISFDKINQNFTEVYNAIGGAGNVGTLAPTLTVTASLTSTGNTSINASTLTLFDGTDTTKKLHISASNISTGQTRTFNVPDASTTFVGIDTVQTLTNKTINGSNNTISNIDLTSAVTGVLPKSNGGTGGLLTYQYGGTGISTSPSNGQLLIGNGSGFSLATLTAGSGVSIINTSGGIIIASTGGGGGGGGSGAVSTGTQNRLAYYGSTGTTVQDSGSGLTWDGTTLTATALSVTGNVSSGNISTTGLANIGSLIVTGTGSITGNLTAGNISATAITGLASPVNSSDAANKSYVDGKVNVNSFNTFAVSGQSNVVAASSTDTLTFVAGAGITISTNAGTKQITFTAANVSGGGAGGTVTSGTQYRLAYYATTGNTVSDAGSGLTWNGTNLSVTGSVLSTANIRTSVVPSVGSDLINKTYGDANYVYTLPKATSSALGGIIVAGGSGLSVNAAGYLSANSATVTNSFATIQVAGQSNVAAASATDQLTFVAGGNVTITTNPGTNSITINAIAGTGGGNIVANMSAISSNNVSVLTQAGVGNVGGLVVTSIDGNTAIQANSNVTIYSTSIQAMPGTTSRAPIVVPAGSKLTTPQSGAIEYDSTNFYVTIGSTRKQVATYDQITAGTVTAFNSRTGNVILNSNDINTALGYTPFSSNTGGNVGGSMTVIGNITTATVFGTTGGSITTNYANIASNLTVGNITMSGTLNGGMIVGTITTASQPNITSVGVLTGLTMAGDLTMNSGNIVTPTTTINSGISTTSLSAATIGNTGAVHIGTLSTNAQPNITSVGTLTGLTLSGTLTGTTINAAVIGNIGAVHIGTLSTNAQPNITSVGTLGTLSVTGNITAGNVNANTFGTHTGSVTGNVTGTILTASQPNITSVGTLGNLTVTGNITAGNVNANTSGVHTGSVVGNASSATKLATARNINSVSFDGTADITVAAAAGTLTGTTLSSNVTSSSLTSVGTLANLAVNGSVTINNGSNATAIVNAGSAGLGNIGASGAGFNTVFAKATSAQYADLAEKYLPDQDYAIGTVVVIGGSAEVTASSVGQRAIGAVSEKPAYMMNCDLEGGTYIALKGRVPVLVTGAIQKGDRLVAGPLGTAVKATLEYYSDTFAIALESSSNENIKTIEAIIL